MKLPLLPKTIKLSKVSGKTDDDHLSALLEEILIWKKKIVNFEWEVQHEFILMNRVVFHWHFPKNRNLSEKCSAHELVIFFGPPQNITFSCVCKCWKQIMKIKVQNHNNFIDRHTKKMSIRGQLTNYRFLMWPKHEPKCFSNWKRCNEIKLINLI